MFKNLKLTMTAIALVATFAGVSLARAETSPAPTNNMTAGNSPGTSGMMGNSSGTGMMGSHSKTGSMNGGDMMGMTAMMTACTNTMAAQTNLMNAMTNELNAQTNALAHAAAAPK